MQLKRSVLHVVVVFDHKNLSLSITPRLRLREINKMKRMQVLTYHEPYRKEIQTRSKNESEQEGQVLLEVRLTLQLQAGFIEPGVCDLAPKLQYHPQPRHQCPSPA